MSMSEEQGATTNRAELLERLKNLDALQSQGTLAELAYRRAREALEKALEEAAKVRLGALEDARGTRERELSLLMESLKALRLSAEAQIHSILTSAEVQAQHMLESARLEAQRLQEDARHQVDEIAAEAAAIRHAAEQRAREVQELEGEFNQVIERLVARLGVAEKPAEGWFRALSRGKSK